MSEEHLTRASRILELTDAWEDLSLLVIADAIEKAGPDYERDAAHMLEQIGLPPLSQIAFKRRLGKLQTLTSVPRRPDVSRSPTACTKQRSG